MDFLLAPIYDCFHFQRIKHGCIMLLMGMVCASNIQAKERPFYGQIVNDSGKGIRGATLVVTPPNAQYQTDRNGYFSFNADEATSTALLIVAQDFESTKFDISILPEDSIIIELAKKKHILQDAFVGSKSSFWNIAPRVYTQAPMPLVAT
jgi:hypothetical protein